MLFSVQHCAKLNLYCRIAEQPTSPNAIICFIHTAPGTSASIELANRSLLSNWKPEAPFRAMTHIMWKSQSYILNETQDNGGLEGCVCVVASVFVHPLTYTFTYSMCLLGFLCIDTIDLISFLVNSYTFRRVCVCVIVRRHERPLAYL